MSTRSTIVLGLFAGLATAFVAGALVVAIGPEVALLPSAAPSPPAATAAPVDGASPTPGEPAASAGTGPTTLPPASPGAASAAPPTAGQVGLRIGTVAPPLVVPQLGGGTIELARLRGHPVWIEFMATWCPSCRDEFPHMSGFAARYAEAGLVVVAIDVREDVGAVAAFAGLTGAAFPIGLDADGAAARTWRVAALPSHVFVDAEGVVREVIVGGIGPDVMAARLSMIMPGVTVRP